MSVGWAVVEASSCVCYCSTSISRCLCRVTATSARPIVPPTCPHASLNHPPLSIPVPVRSSARPPVCLSDHACASIRHAEPCYTTSPLTLSLLPLHRHSTLEFDTTSAHNISDRCMTKMVCMEQHKRHTTCSGTRGIPHVLGQTV